MMEQHILREGEALARAMVTAVCISMEGQVRRPPKWMVQAWTPRVIPE
jgi:acyl-CoA thioesterase FadM